MSDVSNTTTWPARLRRYFWLVVACWTVAIGIVLAWEVTDEESQALRRARSAADGIWNKDMAVRRWSAINGGTYVPVTPETQPDPYLEGVPDRDITTPLGRKLTLIGPAAITRTIDRTTQSEFGTHGHMTSLQPIRPDNAPDAWEKKALMAFEEGEAEVYSVEQSNGEPYMRLMRPVKVEATCLKCHAEEGRKEGELRGGISVSVPMALVWPGEREQIIRRILGYGGMWVLGLCGIVVMSRAIQNQFAQRREAEQKLQEANDLLETRVAERTSDLAAVNRELEGQINERKQAETWLMESEQRFRGYFEQGLVGMAILSPAREWLEVNQRMCKLAGYTEHELTRKTWGELTHPDDREAEDLKFAKMLGGSLHGYISKIRLVRKDGRNLQVSLSMQCMRKENGAVDCILTLVQDLSEMK